ncbi:hypothetical protein [Chitinimonas koreensis]|uniref:hypothetical protein n=1 Tax=Chitinimonas koreensis TaxID=356302 RepID=UPI000415D669|nr:hypothetical protein [Chitinimonas koreensis]QNM94906.1 hypothetical protein H9L41_13340 [Chitinimonas koreensis]
MKIVKVLKPFGPYTVGDVAGFDDAYAEKLIGQKRVEPCGEKTDKAKPGGKTPPPPAA